MVEEPDFYPRPETQRVRGSKARVRLRQRVVAELGDPQKRTDPVPVDDAREMHGRKIRPGVRPLVKVSRSSRFVPLLTERQQRNGYVRTARSWGRMMDMLDRTGMTLEEFVETLDPEELVYGKLKDKNGRFTGRPPAWVPREFHQACIRELMRRGKRMWQENYLVAIESMTEIAAGKVKGASASDRLKAAQFVVERIEGKTPERVEIVEESPWQSVISEIVAEVPDEYLIQARAARVALTDVVQQEIHDAEVVEEPPPAGPRRSAARRARRADR